MQMAFILVHDLLTVPRHSALSNAFRMTKWRRDSGGLLNPPRSLCSKLRNRRVARAVRAVTPWSGVPRSCRSLVFIFITLDIARA